MKIKLKNTLKLNYNSNNKNNIAIITVDLEEATNVPFHIFNLDEE